MVIRTLPLAAFRWAKDVARDGAPVSPRGSALKPLDFLLRRTASPLASCEVEDWSCTVLSGGNGSVVAMLGGSDSDSNSGGDGRCSMFDGRWSVVNERVDGTKDGTSPRGNTGWLAIG